jgi:hypothetical protein
MNVIAGQFPRVTARVTAVFYILTIVLGLLAQMYLSAKMIVQGDAAATAANILSHKGLFRASFAIYLVEMGCNVATTVFFYQLLRPVSRGFSLLAAVFGLTGCGIKTFSRLFYIAPLLILGGAPYLNVFDAKQLQALALLSLRVNDHGAAMAMVFFGFGAFVEGCLMVRAIFLPRVLGVLSMAGGVGWMTFLYTPLGYAAFPYVALVALIGSLSLIGWLLVAGVDEERWYAQEAALQRGSRHEPGGFAGGVVATTV